MADSGGETTLHSLATQCMRETNWNLDQARQRLESLIDENEELRVEALHLGLMTLLSQVSSAQRDSLCRSVAKGTDDVRALRRMADTSYLETWLVYGGKKLGDSSPDDLRKSIQRRAAESETLRTRIAFETAVLKKLKPTTKKVRDDLDEDELRRIAKRVMS